MHELGACHHQTLGVGLARSEVQQRYGLPGRWNLVGLDAHVHQLEDFFDPCTGVSKCLNKRPGPEGVVLFKGQVPVLSVAPNPDMRMLTALEDFPSLAVHVDGLAGAGCSGIRQGCFCCAEGLFGGLHQARQHGCQFSGALLHRCDGGAPVLHVTAGFGEGNGAWGDPLRPEGIFECPLADVEIERPDGEEDAVNFPARRAVGFDFDSWLSSRPPAPGSVRSCVGQGGA